MGVFPLIAVDFGSSPLIHMEDLILHQIILPHTSRDYNILCLDWWIDWLQLSHVMVYQANFISARENVTSSSDTGKTSHNYPMYVPATGCRKLPATYRAKIDWYLSSLNIIHHFQVLLWLPHNRRHLYSIKSKTGVWLCREPRKMV